ncbi:MAG: response regulator transcription factor [Pseudonocardiaceae bacterium]
MTVGTGKISVVLVDDHTLFREGLAELLASDTTFQVVAQGSDGADALALVTEHRPDVVLVDVEMPGPGARATVSRLHHEHPDTRVIVLTMHDKPELAWELLDQGAAAYLVKTIARQELIAAVRSVVTSRGNILLSVSRRTIHQLDKLPPNVVLSARELEVLQLVALAMSNAQIGRQLVIAEGTVKRHLTNIYAKLGAVSRVDAIRKASAARLIPGIDS